MIARCFLILAAIGLAAGTSRAQTDASLFAARQKPGERMTYQMKGVNEDWKYEVEASGTVRKDSNGNLVEEFTWSHLVSNGAAVDLPSPGGEFHEVLSLDPDKPPLMPNLAAAPPMLIGPITDLGTFYVDLWLAAKLGSKLARAGDHADFNIGIPGSWADGKRVLTGQSAVNFEFTVLNTDRAANTTTLQVRHVPPVEPRVQLPAPWMQEPAGTSPSNWVQVVNRDGGFAAGAGKETFDVRIEVSLADGKILSATMDNLVEGKERDCRDRALSNCAEARPFRIFRHIELSQKNQ